MDRIWSLYSATCLNGKIYFGVTGRSVTSRWSQHLLDARKGSRLRFHCAIRKHGADNIVVRRLVAGTKSYILDLEIRAIAAFRTADVHYGYNTTHGGDGALGRPPSEKAIALLIKRSTGRKHSPETIARMRANRAGLGKWTEERRENMRAILTSRTHSVETRAKMSASMKGIKRGPEAGANISAAKKGKPRRGVPHTLESRAKISAAKKGQGLGVKRGPCPAERRAKISATKMARAE